MTYFYSPSDNGFYDDVVRELYENAGTWPDDGIEVDDSVFNEFTNTPPEGKTRGHDKEGMPKWVDLPKPTKEELIAMANEKKASLRAEADFVITPLQDAVEMEEATEDEAALLTKWKKYRILLNRVDTQTAPDIEWPEKPA